MSAGRIALVTGATDGIGRALAVQLAASGRVDRLLLVGRDPRRGKETCADITAAAPDVAATFLPADLSLMREVAHLADAVLAQAPRLEMLVHSAGIIAGERRITAEGHELNWALNYLSRFLLTTRLLPALEAAAPARVLIVGGPGQPGRIAFDDPSLTKRWRVMRSLQQFQKANDVFVTEAARRWCASGVGIAVTTPGLVATRIRRDIGAFKLLDVLLRPVMKSPDAAARPILDLLLMNDFAMRSGGLFSGKRPLVAKPDVTDPAMGERLWAFSEAAVRQV